MVQLLLECLYPRSCISVKYFGSVNQEIISCWLIMFSFCISFFFFQRKTCLYCIMKVYCANSNLLDSSFVDNANSIVGPIFKRRKKIRKFSCSIRPAPKNYCFCPFFPYYGYLSLWKLLCDLLCRFIYFLIKLTIFLITVNPF